MRARVVRHTSTALLIRHAATDALGVSLSGRMEGIHLSERGHAEAARLRDRLADVPLDAIYSSPLERARETADAIAERRDVRVEVFDRLTELDFGWWTGKTFRELAYDPLWHAFNAQRSTAPIPGGEHPLGVQRRAVASLQNLARRHRTGVIAVVSHADVIRSAILWCRAQSLDRWQQVAVDTTSVTAVALDPPLRILSDAAWERRLRSAQRASREAPATLSI